MVERLNDPLCDIAKEKLRMLGVEAVLYDLDDTLIHTTEIFIKCLSDYAEKVSLETTLSADEILRTVMEIDAEEYKTMGVNPERWGSVVNKTGEHFPDHKNVLVDNIDLLRKIYITVPRVRVGAISMLQTLKRAGVKQALVTHANLRWTYWKLDRTGLVDYFDSVCIADENGHKTADDWGRAMRSLSVDPKNCLVVGDSLGGDIRPAHSLGARTMWVEGSWSVTRAGSVPSETVQLRQVSEVLEALGRLR